MGSSIRIIEIHEREARVFPREILFDSSGKSLLLPETRALSAIDLRDVLDGVELRALGLIGYLPLTKDIVLNVQPKFPVKNLWKMLSVADETYDRILPVVRSYEISNASAPHQLLIRSFCHYLRSILTSGIARGYYQEPYRGHFKPKVNFGRTVASHLSRGDYVSVEADIFSFSSDLNVNRLIKSACLDFLHLMPRSAHWLNDRRLLLEALNALHNVKPARMQFGEQDASSSLPKWLREAYYGALNVYSVLLGFTKVGFSYNGSGSAMPSFLFSLDKIFESFTRNTFQKVLSEKTLSVYDGNATQHQAPLFLNNKRFLIKPDLIFRKGKVIAGVGEVKYKPKIAENDRYQVISHVVALGAPYGIWISPTVDGDAGLEFIGAISTGAKFYHYKLNISDDLDKTSISMVNEIVALIT